MNEFTDDFASSSSKTVSKDTDRDNFMSAKDALKYGLIDKVMGQRGET